MYEKILSEMESMEPESIPDKVTEEKEKVIESAVDYFKSLLNDRFTVVGAYKDSLDRFNKGDLEGFYEELSKAGAYDIDIFSEYNLKYPLKDNPVAEIVRLCGIEEDVQNKVSAAVGTEIFPSKKYNGIVLRGLLQYGLFINKVGSIEKLAGIEGRNYTSRELMALYRHNMEQNTLNALERIAGGFNNSYVESFLISDLAVLRDAILDYFRKRYGTSIYDIAALPVSDFDNSSKSGASRSYGMHYMDHPLFVPGFIRNMYDNDLLSDHNANKDISAISGNVLAIAQDIGMIQEVSDLVEQIGIENSNKYLNRMFERVSRQVQEKYFSYAGSQASSTAAEINNLGERIFIMGEQSVVNGYGESMAPQVKKYMVKNSTSLPYILIDLVCDSLKDSSYEDIVSGKYMEQLLTDFGVLDTVKSEVAKLNQPVER